MTPPVSILIPCFNAEKLIGEAIESALQQTGVPTEVIVVDDGSTDGSRDVIRRFAAHISWETGPNRGAPAARNRLLELASGPWLQYLDADDYLRPGKISGQVEFAGTHPTADVICSPAVWEKGAAGNLYWVETSFAEPRDPWVMLALWTLPQTGGPLWRRSALQRVGGWRIGQPCCQEHELYCRLLKAGCRFEFFDECRAVYRDWDHSPRLTMRVRLEVDRQRLDILGQMEAFLSESGQLTADRHQAINDARLELARKLWPRDSAAAGLIAQRIRDSDNQFAPSLSAASPKSYRVAYRMLGFHRAERIASVRRRLRGAVARRTAAS